MNMWRINRNKKAVAVIAIVIISFTVAVAGFLWLQHKPAASHQIAQTCSDYGSTVDYFDGPASFQEMANDSVAVVIATAEDPEALGNSVHRDGPTPTVRAKEVLKGNVRVNDILPICAGMGYVDLSAGEHPTIVLFAENKDGNTWIPVWGRAGIVPQKENGRFEMNAVSEGSKSVTLDELRKIVK